MASGTSYNGWSANSDPGAIGINPNFSVDGMKFPGGVRGGDVQIIYEYLVPDLVKIDPPTSKEYNVEGFWGYSYKPNTNNPNVLSCHASGTAIDYRAVAHPNVRGSSYIGWSSSQIAAVQRLLSEKYEGLVKWLSYDSMHFEIGGTPGQIRTLAFRLTANKPTPAPSPEPEPPNGGDDNDMADITDAQMDKIAEKCASKVWAKIIQFQYTDQQSGATNSEKKAAADLLSAATTWSGNAAWQAKQAAKK
jgi:hypothetical protein